MAYYPTADGETCCVECTGSSLTIYATSKAWTHPTKYDEDKFHAEISKFVTHFKAEHKKGSFK